MAIDKLIMYLYHLIIFNIHYNWSKRAVSKSSGEIITIIIIIILLWHNYTLQLEKNKIQSLGRKLANKLATFEWCLYKETWLIDQKTNAQNNITNNL